MFDKYWQILTRRQKKYANLANFEREIIKYENLADSGQETEKV